VLRSRSALASHHDVRPDRDYLQIDRVVQLFALGVAKSDV
jgi:hypothetical protein